MYSKSYTKEEILAARKEGKKLFELDTANDGEDDILIAEKGETESDILNDILYHLSCDSEPRNVENPDKLPKGWELREIPEDEKLDFEEEESND